MRADWIALWRRWHARPLLPALALLVLVAGVSAGATVLGLSWAVLFRGLPYADAGRLAVVQSAFPGMSLAGMGLSGPEATELRSLARAFTDVGFGYLGGGLVDAGGAPVRAEVARVSAAFVAALGATVDAGRIFTAADDTPSSGCVAVLGRRFEKQYLDPGKEAIGAVLRVDGEACTVVGVWPDRLDFVGRPADVWVPLRYDVTSPSANRANHAFTVLARIRPGLSADAAREDLGRAVDGWVEATGQFHSPSTRFHPLSLTPVEETIRGPVRSTALVLVASVLTMIAVTIANAAGLLVADADRRRQELTIRAVLGADRRRLWRMHLVEAGTLAGIAGLLGGACALGVSQVAGASAPASLARLDVALPGWQTAAIAAAIAAVAAGICSLVQAGRLPWTRLASVLGADSRTGTPTAARHRLRRWLVGVEVALAVGLVAAGALMIESVGRLTRVDLGFRPAGVLRAQINLPSDRYDTRARIDAFYDALAARLRVRPDVTAVGALTGLVPERRANNSSFMAEGATMDSHLGTPPMQFLQYLTPDAFAALGISLRRGRLFTPADNATSQAVVILNERAAAAYFAGREAVGGRLRSMGSGARWLTVVGVVDDVRQNGLVRPPGTELFVPVAQADGALGGGGFTRDLQVMVRVRAGDPASIAPSLREAVREIDPGAAVSAVEPLDALVRRSIATERFLMALLAAFAAIAVLVAAVGVYGVVAHAVAERTREIGIRRALGASSASLARLVVGRLAPLVAFGLAAGIGLSAGALRLLVPFSFGVDAASPVRLVIVACGLALVAGLAFVRPLAAALVVDPASALRQP